MQGISQKTPLTISDYEIIFYNRGNTDPVIIVLKAIYSGCHARFAKFRRPGRLNGYLEL